MCVHIHNLCVFTCQRVAHIHILHKYCLQLYIRVLYVYTYIQYNRYVRIDRSLLNNKKRIWYILLPCVTTAAVLVFITLNSAALLFEFCIKIVKRFDFQLQRTLAARRQRHWAAADDGCSKIHLRFVWLFCVCFVCSFLCRYSSKQIVRLSDWLSVCLSIGSCLFQTIYD